MNNNKTSEQNDQELIACVKTIVNSSYSRGYENGCERGARKMRERCATRCERDGGPNGIEYAKIIRALPLREGE